LLLAEGQMRLPMIKPVSLGVVRIIILMPASYLPTGTDDGQTLCQSDHLRLRLLRRL